MPSRLIAQTLRLIALLTSLAITAVVLLGELPQRLWPAVIEVRGFAVATILFLAVTKSENCIGAATQVLLFIWLVGTGSSAIELLAVATVTALLKLAAKVLALRRRQRFQTELAPFL